MLSFVWLGLVGWLLFKEAANRRLKISLSQIFELCLHSQQLEEEKRTLSDKDAQNLSELENLRHQLTELMRETQRRESMPADDKMEVSRPGGAGGVPIAGAESLFALLTACSSSIAC